MSEALFFNSEDKANLYEQFEPEADLPSSIEEALSESRGGDPVEWIPEAEIYSQKIAEAVANGSNIAMISDTPETEGVFAGYYEVKIPLIDLSDVEPKLVIRSVYATFEQIAIGHFIAPKEGMFCIDPEN